MARKSPATREPAFTVEERRRGHLPSSGRLMGVVVEVFDLRQESEYLRSSTAQRCFKGAAVSARSKSRIIREVALGLQASVGEPNELGSVQLLGTAVTTWDGFRDTTSALSKLLESSGAPWAIPALIVRGLIARGVDACLDAVDEESRPPVRHGGVGSLLRRWQDGGSRRISRDALAEAVGCCTNTVDAWMDQGVLPKPDKIRVLARFFGERLGRSEGRLAIELRYRCARVRFVEWLRRGVRRRSADAEGLVRGRSPARAWLAARPESSLSPPG
jgi:hypothetical protein